MPKAITQQDVQLMVEMIRNWPKSQPFKWETICIGARTILGYEPTRQALSRKPALVNAYEVKKKHLRAEVDKLSKVTRPRTTLDAMERIARLEEEKDQLKAEVARMAEIARRFIYNASINGLTRDKLMARLPEKKNNGEEQ